MREKRRVKLAERQIMLTRIARRETMAALAQSIDRENQSAALGQRSRMLLEGYAMREDLADGQALREVAALAGGLARLADNADSQRVIAQQQVERQADALAGTDARLKRLEEHFRTARRALTKIEDARAGYGGDQVAQKLLDTGQTRTRTRK